MSERYRVGRHNARVIYEQRGAEPDRAVDVMVGAMDTPELGRRVVGALNGEPSPPATDHDDITHAQARAEALRRLREADRLYAEWRALPPEERTADHLIMLDACQMRQTAIGYAALGGGGL